MKTKLNKRIKKALDEDMEVRMIGENSFKVKGKYIVDIDLTCTCPDFQYSGKPCKHIWKILLVMGCND